MTADHISSFIVRCQPHCMQRVISAMEAMPGVEVHNTDPLGKFVALLERPSERDLLDTISAIEQMDGVLNASMVYHHIDNEQTPTP